MDDQLWSMAGGGGAWGDGASRTRKIRTTVKPHCAYTSDAARKTHGAHNSNIEWSMKARRLKDSRIGTTAQEQHPIRSVAVA